MFSSKKYQSIIFSFKKQYNRLIDNKMNTMRLFGNLVKKSHQSIIKVSSYLFFTRYFMPSLNLLCFIAVLF